jgi:hypothetical protein
MNDANFAAFVEKYRLLRLGSMDYLFLLAWRPRLDQFEAADLTAAVDDVAADPRAGFPLNDLPLLIEYASTRAASRRPGWKDPFAEEKTPELTTDWNRRMVENGVITKKEFDRRERAKERIS